MIIIIIDIIVSNVYSWYCYYYCKHQGVFATRSPHRPNPVGVTLAIIDFIDKKNRTIYLKGCDLVDGTPVLDIKVVLFYYCYIFIILIALCISI